MKKASVTSRSFKNIFCASAVLGLTHTSMAATWTAGHGDFGVGFNGTEFEFGWHLGEGNDTATVDGAIVDDMEFEPGDLQVRVINSLPVVAGTDQTLLDGTGAIIGSDIYLIPQDADGISSVILGLGTEELEQPAGVTWSDVTFTLNSMTGPGMFSLYFNNGNSLDFGISQALGTDSFTFPAGGHEERNWAFTEEGTYTLEFTAMATRTDGTGSTPYSSTGSFTFLVVPEPSSTFLLGLSTIGFLTRRRRS